MSNTPLRTLGLAAMIAVGIPVAVTGQTGPQAQTPKEASAQTDDLEERAALLLSFSGAGYPVEEERQMLATALQAAKEEPTEDNRERLRQATIQYRETTNVVMPETGKAYRIYATMGGGANDDGIERDNSERHLLYYPGKEDPLTTTTDALTAGNSAIFVCRKLDDGSYFFVNGNTGNVLVWRSDMTDATTPKGLNHNLGFQKKYNANRSPLFIQSFGIPAFGSFGIQGHCQSPKVLCFFTVKADGLLDNSTEAELSADRTNCLRLEEVDYANTVTFRPPKAQDGYAYSTLYLPFTIDLPDDVETYYADQTPENNRLNLTLWATENLERSSAVVMRVASENGAQATRTLLPSTKAGTALTDNLLDGTVDEESVENDHTYFVLNGGQGSIGFYKYSTANAYMPMYKAWYKESALSAANGLLFSFRQTPTPIEAAESAEQPGKSRCHDLSGRRVANPAKGIFIKDGKKTYIK